LYALKGLSARWGTVKIGPSWNVGHVGKACPPGVANEEFCVFGKKAGKP